jgi:hypothetical protein
VEGDEDQLGDFFTQGEGFHPAADVGGLVGRLGRRRFAHGGGGEG